MIDMKLSHEESPAGATALGQPSENNGPKYPYGLTLQLDSTSLKKLAMGLPQVGDVFTLDALVEVTAVAKDSGQIEDGKTVTLQITAMSLENPAEEMNEQQKAMAQVNRMYS
jgi:hypothetical protein